VEKPDEQPSFALLALHREEQNALLRLAAQHLFEPIQFRLAVYKVR